MQYQRSASRPAAPYRPAYGYPNDVRAPAMPAYNYGYAQQPTLATAEPGADMVLIL